MSDKLNKLHRAISEVRPDKADQLVSKYQNVVGSLNLALTEKREPAKQAQNQINKMTDDIIADNFRDQREVLIDSFDQELSSIGDYFAPKQAVESNEVKNTFEYIESFFKNLNINFDSATYLKMYFAMPVEIRLPISRISQAFKEFSNVSESDFLKSKLYEHKYDLVSILTLLISGNVESAERKISLILSSMDTYKEIERVYLEVGIRELDMTSFNSLLSILEAESVKKEKISGYVKTIKADLNFAKIGKTVSAEELVVILADSIISLDRNAGKESIVKKNLEVKAYFYNERSSLQRSLKKYAAAIQLLQKTIDSSQDEVLVGQSKHELDLTLQKANKIQARLILSGIKHEAAISTLNQYKGKQNVVKEILAVESSDALKAVLVKYNLPVSDELSKVKLLEIQGIGLQSDVDSSNLVAKYSDVRSLYFNMLKGYKPQGKEKDFAIDYYSKQLESQITTSNSLLNELKVEEAFFKSIYPKYKSIQEIPADGREYTMRRVSTYVLYLAKYYEAQGKILDLTGTLDLLGHTPADFLEFAPMTIGKNGNNSQKEDVVEVSWKGKIKEIREEALGTKEDLADALTFVGSDNQVPNIDTISINPMQVELLANEVSPILNSFGEYLDPTIKSFKGLAKVEENFKGPDVRYKHFREAFSVMNSCIKSVENGRGYLIKTQNQLLAKRGQIPEIIKHHPQLVKVRDEIYKDLISQVDWFLHGEESPFGSKSLSKLEDGVRNLKVAYEDFDTKKILNLVAITAIIATAVFGGILLGSLARVGMGAAISTGVKAGTIGTGVASFAVGSAQLMGMSFGGVIFSRLGMIGTNKLGMSQFPVSWKAEDLSQDFLIAFGTSLAVMGSARLVLSAAGKAASSTIPTISKLGNGTLSRLGSLQKYASPYKYWLQTKNKPLSTTFGRVFGEEYAEELVETAGEVVNPVLGFLLSMTNSADVNVGADALSGDTEKIDVGIESGKLVFKDLDAHEFVENLKTVFGQSAMADLNVKYNSDGSVTLTSKGKEIDVHPSKTGMTPDAEVGRIVNSLNLNLDGQGNLDLDVSGFASFITNLEESGFDYKVNGGTLTVSKLDFSREFKVNPLVISKFEGNINIVGKSIEVINDILTRNAGKELPKSEGLTLLGAVRNLVTAAGVLFPRVALGVDFNTLTKSWDWLTQKGEWLWQGALLTVTIITINFVIKKIAAPLADFIAPIGIKMFKNKYSKDMRKAVRQLQSISTERNGLMTDNYSNEFSAFLDPANPLNFNTLLGKNEIEVDGLTVDANLYLNEKVAQYVTEIKAKVTTEVARAKSMDSMKKFHVEKLNTALQEFKSNLDGFLAEFKKHPPASRDIAKMEAFLKGAMEAEEKLEDIFNDATPESIAEHLTDKLKTPGKWMSSMWLVVMVWLILAHLKQCGGGGANNTTKPDDEPESVTPVAPPTGGGSTPVLPPPQSPGSGGGTVAPPPAPGSGGGTVAPPPAPESGGGTPPPAKPKRKIIIKGK